MTDTCKFPGGSEVKVVRKQDIIDCINCNIVDKDVALAIVQQCELDAANFLRNGRWAGIPFLGSIRPSPISKLEKSPEQRQLIDDAFHTATTEQFVLFRRDLAHDNERRVKAQRYYNYVLSMAVSRNRKLFVRLVKEHGEPYARLRMFLSRSIVAVSNEFEYIDYAEDSNNR